MSPPLGFGLLSRFRHSSAWDPSAVASKTLFWLRADSNISGHNWTDKTNGHVFTSANAITSDSSGINGKPRIILASTNDGLVCSGLTSSATKAHVFAIGKISAVNAAHSLWSIGGTGNIEFFTFSDGNIYETCGSNSRYDSIANPLSAGASFAYEVKADASGNWSAIMNGSSLSTQIGNTIAWAANMQIGLSSNLGYGFSGEIEEVLCLTDNMTSGERASWVSYVLSRYGLSA